MKQVLILVLGIFLTSSAVTQEVSNVWFEQVGKEIHIYYDLTGDETSTVEVYCSTDQGKTWGRSLKEVIGNVGENQVAGHQKRIVWDVLREVTDLEGDISFRIITNTPNLDDNDYTGMSGTFMDHRDGQEYKWVRIGEQIWMAENLNTGVMVKGGQNQKDNSIIEKYCYENEINNCEVFGGLYHWSEAINYIKQPETKGICPHGWHIPLTSEWEDLFILLGGRGIAGGKMKVTGTDLMRNSEKKVLINRGASNSSGFSAIGSGCKSRLRFNALYEVGFFRISDNGGAFAVRAKDSKVAKNPPDKNAGFSVRCIKD